MTTSRSTNPPPALEDLQIFETLKGQILSIATALYGTPSSSPTTAFDIVTYTTPSASVSTSPLCPPLAKEQEVTYGVALITYPSASAFTTWEVLSQVEGEPCIVRGLEKLLQDLRAGMGSVMSELQAKGMWSVSHSCTPDLAGRCREEHVLAAPACSETWSGRFDGLPGGLTSIKEE